MLQIMKIIKKELGIRGEFCIYVVDQYGRIITVNDACRTILEVLAMVIIQ